MTDFNLRNLQAIFTRYIGPTGKRPYTKVRARAAAGSITIRWDNELSDLKNHVAAAKALIDKQNWGCDTDQWVIGGSLTNSADAYVFTCNDRKRPENYSI